MSTASPNASVWGRNGRRFAAWGIGVDGRKVLLALMAGSKEGVETVRAFFRTCAHEAWAIPVLWRDPRCMIRALAFRSIAFGRKWLNT
jgi:hypothetical protein